MIAERVSGVVILGAGYAGMHAARAAANAGAAVTIVDRGPNHGFTTRLAAVAGGTAPLGDAFAPLDAFAHTRRAIDVGELGDGVLIASDGTRVEADALVVATGARPIQAGIPGLERALPLRTPAHALRLRERLESAEELSIVGGGPTGVQLAGAAARAWPGLRIRVIDREDTLLSTMDSALAERAQDILTRRGVEVLLGAELSEVTADGLTLTDGRQLAGVVVWAGGFEPAVDELGDGLPLDEGALEVDEHLRVAGFDRTFAAGDIAAHRRADGSLLPMSAQVAVQAGAAAGENAARRTKGQSLKPVVLNHRGWVLDMGGGQGVARVGPVPLATTVVDRAPPLLHLGIDLRHLVRIGGADALRFRPGAHSPSRADLASAVD